jgi:hypothetical protein
MEEQELLISSVTQGQLEKIMEIMHLSASSREISCLTKKKKRVQLIHEFLLD